MTGPCRTRTLVLGLCAAAVAAGIVTAPAAPAAATGRDLVALGDSYASGLGTRSYFASSAGCKRSPYAYPVLAAHRLSADLTFLACAGATTITVLQDQVSALSRATTDVTLTVGGNDAGFRSVVITCAQPRWVSDCDGAIDSAQAYITGPLPARLNKLFRVVRSRAPGAGVVVTGYPKLFNGEDCNAGTWFSPTEEERLNATADLLDALIRRRAQAHGFAFADPRSVFTGHAVCASTEWVNGLSSPLSESYHPNRAGQAAYADLVGHRLS
jgi:lysophospholipase L1-like esterase